ncbi:putative carboxymethylenebutenolidase [Mercenaria mercenaria]|uniref:putative carboxymethylenebutenolidase n=1 Tax=Mercenaria mercenaria TaxID=6596 RepID=UPI00234F2057|nr:putative carboxymethylenebutenolidase [Mercenaria mercenaria]
MKCRMPPSRGGLRSLKAVVTLLMMHQNWDVLVVLLLTLWLTKMTSVTFSSENVAGDCPGTLYGDPSSTSFAVIVLQEWWGVTDEVKSKAQEVQKRCACVTFIPDLYRGKVTKDYEEAGHWMEGLDWQGAVKDVQGAARFLNSKGLRKVGVTGFCMGGALSLASAALAPEISAAAPFYGLPKPGLCDLSSIRVPVQAHFGELDTFKGFAAPEDARNLAKMLSGKCDFQLYMYPAGHAFCDPNCHRYNKEQTDLAMERLAKFFTEKLT